MVNDKRWRLAQTKEKIFWDNFNYDLKSKDKINQYYINLLDRFIRLTSEDKILEIGASPLGIITSIKRGKLWGLDPLMNSFKKCAKLPKNITWVDGIGEKLPFQNSFFDTILISNVLDHSKEPKKIISEIYRTLKPGGYFLLTSNVFTPAVSFTMNCLESVGCGDPCHPYHFTEKQIKKLLANSKIVYAEHIKPFLEKETKDKTILVRKEKTKFEKFKWYCKEDGVLFAMRLAIFNLVNSILVKTCEKRMHTLFIVQKPKGLNTI